MTHMQLRGRLREVIWSNKKNYFKQMCDHADKNSCGMTYWVVIKRLRRPPQMTSWRLLKKIVAT